MKPVLLPLKVSWQVSNSGANLRLLAKNMESAEVAFTANDIGEDGEFCSSRITIYFKGVVFASMVAAHSDGSSINEAEFDWSQVFSAPELPCEQWLERFNEQWRRLLLCPDPGAYEIKAPGDFSKWIIRGVDQFVEIHAKGIDEIKVEALKEIS